MKLFSKKLRCAVVGVGHIAQVAVLPAFKNSKKCELTALVSGDRDKLKILGRKYKVKNLYSYEQYDQCLRSGNIDAVFIALPNHLHHDYTIRAAKAGVHVLCEKPMAVTSQECIEMIEACEKHKVKLMIAYRLHLEEGNLKAIDLIHREKKIGEPRLFQSIHSQATEYPNIRTEPISKGGGPTYDVGVYDINAARYLFQDEPISVLAQSANSGKPAYKSIEETMSIILRFPKERLASILVSFGTVATDTFRVAGTKGELSLDPAYAYQGDKILQCVSEGKKKQYKIKARDHFAPELDYFAECVFRNKKIEPSGIEGLIDVKIIEAIHQSARTGQVVPLKNLRKMDRPTRDQEISRPQVNEPEPVRAKSPTRETAH